MILWLLLPVILLALFWLARRKRTASAVPVRARTIEHEAMLHYLDGWLRDPAIQRVLLQHRVATAKGLKDTCYALGQMDEAKLKATMAVILRHRLVRQVIAKRLKRLDGLDRREAMPALLAWAKPVKGDAA